MIFLLAISFIELTSILLVLVFLFLGFKVFEQKWSYKISKPYKWEEALRNQNIPNSVIALEKGYRDKVRFYTIWLQIERLKNDKIQGAFAELGVYQGETAKIIHMVDPERSLHLFDTFDGFSEEDLNAEKNSVETFRTYNFSDTSLSLVKRYIDGNEKVQYHPGNFPESAQDLKVSVFAFVHLDADLYKPTIAALQYFYPKLSPGGAIIIHDYNHNWEGIRKAIDEYSQTIPENFAEIADWQGSAMLIKNSQ